MGSEAAMRRAFAGEAARLAPFGRALLAGAEGAACFFATGMGAVYRRGIGLRASGSVGAELGSGPGGSDLVGVFDGLEDGGGEALVGCGEPNREGDEVGVGTGEEGHAGDGVRVGLEARLGAEPGLVRWGGVFDGVVVAVVEL